MYILLTADGPYWNQFSKEDGSNFQNLDEIREFIVSKTARIGDTVEKLKEALEDSAPLFRIITEDAFVEIGELGEVSDVVLQAAIDAAEARREDELKAYVEANREALEEQYAQLGELLGKPGCTECCEQD